MRLLLALVLLAASASAQSVERPVPTTEDVVWLATGAVVTGATTVLFVGPFVPLTVAAATYGISATRGLHPTVGGLVLDTATGFVIGWGAALGTYHLAVEVGGASGDLDTALGALVIGSAIGAAATGLVHGLRLRALRSGGDVVLAPAALAAPAGATGAGVTLTLRL